MSLDASSPVGRSRFESSVDNQIFCCSDVTWMRIAFYAQGVFAFLASAVTFAALLVLGAAAGSPVGFVIAGAAFFAVAFYAFQTASEIYDYEDEGDLKELREEMGRIAKGDHARMDAFLSLHLPDDLMKIVSENQNLQQKLRDHQQAFQVGAQKRKEIEDDYLCCWNEWLARRENERSYPQVPVDRNLLNQIGSAFSDV